MIGPDRSWKARWQEASGLKSLLAFVLIILIYFWSSQGLQITPGELASGETWKNMADLVIRMGPYHRITSCSDANLVWGEDDPFDGKPDPGKVKAVCEGKQTLYWYDFDLLKGQAAYAKQVWGPLAETLRMAILGAFVGALMAIPFSLLAAQNLVKSKIVYYTVRTFLNLIRTIPDLVLAALLAGMFGIGALPGVLALSIFSFALIAKLLSESVESIDPGPLEAIQASGGNRLQQIMFGVVPQVLPQFLAYTLYVLEVDVRASAVLGLVGAGGIGQILYADLNLIRLRNVGAIIIVLLVVVVAMDYISTKLRERLI